MPKTCDILNKEKMIRRVKSGFRANRSLRFIYGRFSSRKDRYYNKMEKKPKKKNIAETVRELVKDAVEECGCTLWDVEYVKEPTGWNLAIYIDREGGISLTDCEMVNDAVEPIIDEADPIEGSYCLEISSPGLERDLKNHEHIEAFLGTEVAVRLYTAIDGTKSVNAILSSHDEEKDTVTFAMADEKELTLERKAIAKLSTVAEF